MLTNAELHFFESGSTYFSKQNSKARQIDWEARRFDLVKEIAASALPKFSDLPCEVFADKAIDLADAIIKRLKERGE